MKKTLTLTTIALFAVSSIGFAEGPGYTTCSDNGNAGCVPHNEYGNPDETVPPGGEPCTVEEEWEVDNDPACPPIVPTTGFMEPIIIQSAKYKGTIQGTTVEKNRITTTTWTQNPDSCVPCNMSGTCYGVETDEEGNYNLESCVYDENSPVLSEEFLGCVS